MEMNSGMQDESSPKMYQAKSAENQVWYWGGGGLKSKLFRMSRSTYWLWTF